MTEGGSIVSDFEVWNDLKDAWKIESDQDVLRSFSAADEFFEAQEEDNSSVRHWSFLT